MSIRTAVTVRSNSIDRLRGLAIALMVLDHVLIFTAPESWRMTITRLSMPLFFIIAGHLVSRVTWRMPAICLIGFLLPWYVSFVDNPNVLFWYGILAPIVVLIRKYPIALWIVVTLGITLFANYGGGQFFGSYHPVALLALMCVGALIPRDIFYSARNLPKWLEFVGTYPLSIYVSHLVIMEAIL